MREVEYDEWGDVTNFILDDGGLLTEYYSMDIVRGHIARGEPRPYRTKARNCNTRCLKRARELGAPATGFAVIIEEMFEQAAPRGCYYCGEAFRDDHDMTIDHKVPLKWGGPHHPRNVVVACGACNQLRNDIGELCLLDPLCVPYNPIAELRCVPQPI